RHCARAAGSGPRSRPCSAVASTAGTWTRRYRQNPYLSVKSESGVYLGVPAILSTSAAVDLHFHPGSRTRRPISCGTQDKVTASNLDRLDRPGEVGGHQEATPDLRPLIGAQRRLGLLQTGSRDGCRSGEAPPWPRPRNPTSSRTPNSARI